MNFDPRGAGRLLSALRLAFVPCAVVFAVVGLRGQWSEIVDALAALRWTQITLAALAIVLAVLCTGVVWTATVRGYDHHLPLPEALRIFFIGQLGKYIPGSIWSFMAQAQMATSFAIPARTTVSAGGLFLGVNLATSAALAGVLRLLTGTPMEIPGWLAALLLLAGTAFLLPPVLTRVGRVLAQRTWGEHCAWCKAVTVTGLMTVTWALYGASTLALLPASQRPTLVYAVVVFAIAYIGGVLVIIAPAGFGVREITMTALLSPVTGLAPAAAAALLSRVLTTAVDFGVALVASLRHLRGGVEDSPE